MLRMSQKILNIFSFAKLSFYYQSGQCPGAGCGLGRGGGVQPSRPPGSTIAPAGAPGPHPAVPVTLCIPLPVPSCSACSRRPVPHLSPDLKHSLTRTSPHLKRTRTPSCACFHSNSTSTRSSAACARKQRESAMEKSPKRKGPTTPDRQAARPLILDCVLCIARVQSTSCAQQPVH